LPPFLATFFFVVLLADASPFLVDFFLVANDHVMYILIINDLLIIHLILGVKNQKKNREPKIQTVIIICGEKRILDDC
jgi:hypothetical protein